MKFKVWESKLCDRLNSWYKAIEKDGQMFVSIEIPHMEFLPLFNIHFVQFILVEFAWPRKNKESNKLFSVL